MAGWCQPPQWREGRTKGTRTNKIWRLGKERTSVWLLTDWSLDSDWLVYEGFISRQFSNLRWLNVLLHPMSYTLQLSIVAIFRILSHSSSDSLCMCWPSTNPGLGWQCQLDSAAQTHGGRAASVSDSMNTIAILFVARNFLVGESNPARTQTWVFLQTQGLEICPENWSVPIAIYTIHPQF